MADILAGAGHSVPCPTICPQNSRVSAPTVHLLGLAYSLCSFKIPRTVCKCFRWSEIESEKISMSSRYTRQNLLSEFHNIEFIIDWNVAGALHSPKGIAMNSYLL